MFDLWVNSGLGVMGGATFGGNVGIGTLSPGEKLDVKGILRLSGSTSGYVGLAPLADAGSTTYILPNTDGTPGQVLATDGSAMLYWTSTVIDNDGDGAGYPTDCYDSNANAYSGQPEWFETHRGDGNFDYNCDGVVTKGWDWNAQCFAPPRRDGWLNVIPDCGITATWAFFPWADCTQFTESRKQKCH